MQTLRKKTSPLKCEYIQRGVMRGKMDVGGKREEMKMLKF